MADLATLSIKVDASGAVTVLDELGNKLGETGKRAATLGGTMAKLGAVLGAGVIFKKFIDETSESQFAMAQLEARVKSTAGAAGQSVGQLSAMASEMQNLTTYSDEAAMGAQALLLTFTKIKGDVFPAALKATANLATAMGGDLKGAAIQLGKALQDPETGLTALRRSGVSFSESQQKVIKALFDTGKVAEAQKLILAELEVEFGGAAEAARKTLGGALLGLKNSFGELFEVSKSSSGGIISALNAVSDAMKTVAENGAAWSGVIAGIATAIGLVTAALVAFKIQALAAASTPIGAAIAGAVLMISGGVAFFTKQLADAQAEVDAYKKNLEGLNAATLTALISATKEDIKSLEIENERADALGSVGERLSAQKVKLNNLEAAFKALSSTVKSATGEVIATIDLEGIAMTKLIKSYEDKADATRREITYVKSHTDELVAQAVREIELAAAMDKVTDAAARKYAQMERLDKLGTGAGVFPIATGFQGGKAPAVSNALGQAAIMEAHALGEATGKARGEAQIAVQTQTEEQLKAIQENFVKQFQQTLSTGIASILENGLSSWRSFFDSIKSMFLKLVADFAAAKIMDKIMGKGQNTAGATGLGAMLGGDFGKGAGGTAMAGASVALTAGMIGYGVGGMTRNTTTGALAGGAAGAASGAALGALLGPIGVGAGALIGGLTGLVGGFLGASAAAKKFATEMVQQQNTLMAAAQAFVDRGLTGQAKIQSEQNKLAKERDDLLKALEANFKAGGFGTGGAANYQRTVEEIGFAYDRQRKALEETTKAVEQQIVAQEAAAVAAEAFNASLTAMDLDARRLAATGFDEQSAATSLFTRQAREYAQAVKDGWSIEQLINLQEVQALEALSAAAKKASTDVIYSANSLAAMADQVVEVSAAWQKTIDGLSEARNAAEQTANAIRKTVDATRTLFDTLSGYMKSLLVGTLSPLTKSQQVAEARSQFEDAARKAAFGDLEAGGKVTGLANTFLQLMKDTSQASAEAARALVPKYFRDQMPAVEGTQTAEYQQAFADVAAMIDAATLGVGGQLDIQVQQLRQAELQTAILGRMLAQANAAARGLPFFAHGGDHSGGMAIVGERGPELINTGRARIFSAADSAAAFAGNSGATVEELRRVIARLETLVRVTAAGAQETVKAVARVSNDVASLTREVRLSGEAAA